MAGFVASKTLSAWNERPMLALPGPKWRGTGFLQVRFHAE